MSIDILRGDHHVHSTFSDDAVSTPEENVAAASVTLTPHDIAQIDAASPHGAATGTRNTEAAMARDRG